MGPDQVIPTASRNTLGLKNSTLTGAGVTVAVVDSGLLQDGGGTSRIKTTRDFTGGAVSPAAHQPAGSATGTARTWPV